MRFTVEPPPGESAFDQWKDAMKAVARLPLGIPDEFRKKVRYSMSSITELCQRKSVFRVFVQVRHKLSGGPPWPSG